MKIGIMLRHITQHVGGVLNYTENLMRELMALETDHEFVLMYRDPAMIGKYAGHPRVKEVAETAPHRTLWDQVAVRRIEKRERLDLIFNPKYAIPLVTDCPTVFVCHGLDWYVMPWGSRFVDRLSHRYLIPRYSRKADAIIAVSEMTRKHVIEYLHVPEDQVHTVYLGVGDEFRAPWPEERLKQVRATYGLPERFLMFCGQIYPAKNFGRLIQAYAKVGPELGIHLVVAGEHRRACEDQVALIDTLGIGDWVVRPGWVDHTELPAIYRMATALVLPSLYEACPSPILEAMASGCPVLTSNRYGTEDLAGGAALLVDPEDVDDIADGMRRIVTEPDLRERLIALGNEHVRPFRWERTAAQTLQVLEKTAGQR